jgi:hypothetical protein
VRKSTKRLQNSKLKKVFYTLNFWQNRNIYHRTYINIKQNTDIFYGKFIILHSLNADFCEIMWNKLWNILVLVT